MKIYIFDPLWPSLITKDHLSKLQNAGVEIQLTIDKHKLTDKHEIFDNPDPKILGINPDFVDWTFPAEKFKNIQNLNAIITQSTSYGWIDINFAKSNDIAVINTRNFSTESVAEWAIMMMLNLSRKIPLLIKNKFPLNFDSDFQTYQGANIKNKKAGIIGLGNIGTSIAHRCEGLGMDVSYWNRTPKKSKYPLQELEELFETCDVIFPAIADTAETKNLITDEMIKSMKETSMLVSVVHKSYNHVYAIERASNNKIWGYAFEDEPAFFDKYNGNIWAAPAYAWCTKQSLDNAMNQFIDLICAAKEGNYINKVN